ncbi:glutamate--cysteine ligase [Pseudomaricurvus alkylphenolicus]|uniref:glutamate--cysteine ligase n=1 Tax=Pseudomaricurvus alkylphenolicus TaxID=1306991 RepID=UPI00141E911D|nr:glutamate--cysteine ligase [Pseudomaricurvus alkylphenolicus]NIB39632.1 glutamate--cysteine ligase [Pseudomaricurvus alkylphenolicus]
MGQDIHSESFSEQEAEQFEERLQQSLGVLKKLLQHPDFGRGELSLGAELESYITDDKGRPLSINRLLLDDLQHPQLQLELNRYNIEYNFAPQLLHGSPFSRLHSEMDQCLTLMGNAAQARGGQIVPIGILPTLEHRDLTEEAMTDLTRYRVLSNTLNRLRGGDFKVDIHGDDDLQVSTSQVVFEGANTSFQVHLRVEPQHYADTFNTLQLVSPLVVALSANSPLLLQRRLWDETRIALFKQSVDYRHRGSGRWQHPARVSFGQGWVRDGAWELFAETVALHRPIMTVLSDRDPHQRYHELYEHPEEIIAPELPELNLHMGSVWPWNRAVYDHNDGGHLRIEMRALPSGPTPLDMVAAAALYVGLALGLRDRIRDWLPSIPFYYAEYNFYRAAQRGLDAVLVWPDPNLHRLAEVPLLDVVESALPFGREGLKTAGVVEEDIERYLSVIEQRFERQCSPARWQRNCLDHYEQKLSRPAACKAMFESYCEQQRSGQPVHLWQPY